MSIHGRNTMLIGGAHASTVELTFNRDYHTVRFFGSEKVERIPTRREATLTCSLIGMSRDAFCHVENMLGTGDLLSLGNGWMCQACGDYNPAGTTRCAKCGGPSRCMPYLAPERFPFVMTELSASNSFDIEMVQMEFQSCGDVTTEIASRLFRGDPLMLASLPSNAIYDPGYYLCRYCGLAVLEGETCSGCGGKRFPWQELASLHRVCVYCGRDVLGGVVCDGCGAGVRGTLLRKVME